LDKIVLRCSET